MRTIAVIFTDRKPRYNSKMMVVGFTCNTDRVQQGITLKDIYITKVNGQVIEQPAGLVNGSLVGSDFDIDKQRVSNMEEKRNIKVTLEQAMEWYNSGNSTLRTLALSAYIEDELKFNLKYISSKVCNTCFCANVPVNEVEKYRTLVDLAVIAKFFNGSWKKTISNTGYFLGDLDTKYGSVIDTCKGVGIHQHNTVQYAGIVYFKDWKNAIKAVEILGDRVKNLFD